MGNGGTVLQWSGTASSVAGVLQTLQFTPAASGSTLVQVSVSDDLGATTVRTVSIDASAAAPGTPTVADVIAAGVSASERNAGFGVGVSLAGTGARAGDGLEILVNGQSVNATRALTAFDIASQSASVTLLLPGAVQIGRAHV